MKEIIPKWSLVEGKVKYCLKKVIFDVILITSSFASVVFNLALPTLSPKPLSPPYSPSHDHLLPQHHSGYTGRGEEDELHCSRGETHNGALGERRTHHQPGDQPICGHC